MAIDTDSVRYAAHVPLSGIGKAGQARISDAHVALIGVGGLGSAAASYLVSSGIGKLTICDFDIVAESNLARQLLYRSEDIGKRKVEVAAQALRAINPQVDIHTLSTRMSDTEMLALFPSCDFVIDASDNFGTRLAVNRSCVKLKLPWLMAACIRLEAQLMLLRPDLPARACYRCAYGSAPDYLEDCPGAGIFAPVAGIAGASAAYFALASIAGLATAEGMHVLDAAHWNWQTIKITQRSECQDC
jgi:molybdopterin/thiamine biosynthesis adenylyltransferase